MDILYQVVVLGVGIPIPTPPIDFITPFWDFVLEFYGEWHKKVKAQGQEPYALQPFMLAVAKELGALEESRYTADGWMRRYFEHFGTNHLEPYVRRYQNLR